MSVWRDNHPDRYGPLEDGGHCVVTEPDGSKHFAVVRIVGNEIAPADGFYACGRECSDWRDWGTRLKMPMGGVVDCPACLRAMEADG